MAMDFMEFNRLGKFQQLVIQSSTKIDQAILTASWTNAGDDLRGDVFLKGDPRSPALLHRFQGATAYELVLFARRSDGAKEMMDWRKYDLVVATGSTYKLGRRTLYLCLKQNGTFVGKPKSVLRRKKTVELLTSF